MDFSALPVRDTHKPLRCPRVWGKRLGKKPRSPERKYKNGIKVCLDAKCLFFYLEPRAQGLCLVLGRWASLWASVLGLGMLKRSAGNSFSKLRFRSVQFLPHAGASSTITVFGSSRHSTTYCHA